MIQTILYILLFTLFTLPVFVGYAVMWCFTAAFDHRRVASWHYSRFWSRTIYRLCPWWKVEFRGLEHIDPNTSYIIVSNHQHMLDIPLLLQLPMNFRFVSKEEVYKIPVFGWVLWMRADVAIKRGGAASAKKMIKDCQVLLDNGVSVAIFPEGTRSKTGEIGSFHSGASLLAKRVNAPILPVAINGNFDAFCGGRKRRNIDLHHKFAVDIMPPITVEQIDGYTLEELSAKMETIIKKEFKDICQN